VTIRQEDLQFEYRFYSLLVTMSSHLFGLSLAIFNSVVKYLISFMSGVDSQRAQLARFGLVGGLGFVIDSGVLYLCLYYTHIGYYSGRLISYLCASSVAWYLHRIYTFKLRCTKGKKSQLMNFVVFNSFGGVANYLIYALLIANYALFREFPVIAVGVGALVGMFINYYLSKKMVFRVD
jgi:putative flippase GtrA